MNVSNRPVFLPIADLMQHAARAPEIAERERVFSPFLASRNILETPYPRELAHAIETAILNAENIFIDEHFFCRVSDALTTTLQLIPMDCRRDEFWSTIRIVRTRLDAASCSGYPEEGNIGNLAPWSSPFPTAMHMTMPGRHGHEPKPLRQLALDSVTGALQNRDTLADEISTHRIALKFALLQMHVAEFTTAVRRYRPDLWALSGPLDQEMTQHVEKALALCDTARDSPCNATEQLLEINHELSWASYYVGGTNWLNPTQSMTDSDMLGAIAIEHVHHCVAAIFNGARQGPGSR